MKPQIIGDYEIGYEYVHLVLRDGLGAEFCRISDDVTIPTITIGADDADWQHIIDRLLHESFELISDRLGCRLYPSGNLARNSAAYVFVLDHQQFADCCAKVAEFLAAALPDLAKAWKARKALALRRKRKGT